MQFELPTAVQRHIMVQLMSGTDVEVRLADGEFRVIALHKKCERFPINEEMNKGEIKKIK